MAYNPSLYMPYSAFSYPSSSTYPYTAPATAPLPGQAASQAVNGLISVTGIDGARAYPMPPNSSMALFDAESDLMYVKTTDGAGFPTIRTYRFEEVDQGAAGDGPGTDSVARSEFDDLVRRVDALTAATVKPPVTATTARGGADDGEQPVPDPKRG